MSATDRVLRTVVEQWKSGIDAHEPHRVAALFSDDAFFQGLHPYSIGPDGVFDYYDGQPRGMTVTYRILEARRVTDDVIYGYLAAEFAFLDRDPIDLRLGIVLVRTGVDWRIASYQASPAPQ